MSGVMEELCEEIARRTEQRTEQKTAQRIAEALINIGEMSLESIAAVVQLPLADIQETAKKLQQQKPA